MLAVATLVLKGALAGPCSACQFTKCLCFAFADRQFDASMQNSHQPAIKFTSKARQLVEINEMGAMDAGKALRIQSRFEAAEREVQDMFAACGMGHNIIADRLEPVDIGNFHGLNVASGAHEEALHETAGKHFAIPVQGSCWAETSNFKRALARSEISPSALELTSFAGDANKVTIAAGTSTALARAVSTRRLGCRRPPSISESWLGEIDIRVANSDCWSPNAARIIRNAFA